jgi:hypothetical protein
VFAAVDGVALGFVNELRFINRTGEVAFSRVIAIGLAECWCLCSLASGVPRSLGSA